MYIGDVNTPDTRRRSYQSGPAVLLKLGGEDEQRHGIGDQPQ
jgi:hypothetical protein